MAGLIALVLVAIAMVVQGDRSDPRVVVVVTCTPIVLALAAIVLRSDVRRRRSSVEAVRQSTADESAVPGLALPYRRDVAYLWLFIAGYLMVGSGVLLAGGVALLAQGRPGGPAAAVIGAALLAAVVPGLISAVRQPPSRRILVLTPEGIRHRSARSDTSVGWTQVLGIAPTGGRTTMVLVTVASPADTTAVVSAARRGLTGLDRRLSPHLVIDASTIDLDPVLLLETLRYYAARPAARAELGTATALDRVRNGGVVVA